MSDEADVFQVVPSLCMQIGLALVCIAPFPVTIYILVIAYPKSIGVCMILGALFWLLGAVLGVMNLYDAFRRSWTLRLTQEGIFIRGLSRFQPTLIRWEDIEEICVEPCGEGSAVCIYRFGKRRPIPLDHFQLDRSLSKMADFLEEWRGAAVAFRIWGSTSTACPHQ